MTVWYLHSGPLHSSTGFSKSSSDLCSSLKIAWSRNQTSIYVYLVWKFNPVIEQFYSQQLSIVHAKTLTKETKYGAEHYTV